MADALATPRFAPGPSDTPRCQRHPAALAGWRCHACEAALCVDCAREQRAGTVELVGCGLCGGATAPILVHRGRLSLARRLPGAWRFPFTQAGLQTLVGLSAVLAVLGWLADWTFSFLRVLPLALSAGIFWAVFFAVLRGSARGDGEPELPEFVDFFRDGIAPGLKGLLVTGLAVLPAVLYNQLFQPHPAGVKVDAIGWYAPLQLSPDALTDAVPWALLLSGLLWLPMALILTAANQPLRDVLNPLGVLARARRLGGDYLLTVGVLLGLGVLHGAAHALGGWLRGAGIFVISLWGAEALTCLAPLLAAHVLGLLLYVRGDAVGYSLARDYLEPVLGDARPTRRAQSLQAPPAWAAEPARAGTDGEPAAMAEGATRAEGGLDPGEVASRLAALASAVEARDVAQAMALYVALRALPGVKVAPAHHLFVGQAAAVEGNFPLSVEALEAAADMAPDAPTAPRALVLLARVLGEHMRDGPRAEEVYRYVVHRYPDTEAARFARERLPPSA